MRMLDWEWGERGGGAGLRETRKANSSNTVIKFLIYSKLQKMNKKQDKV